MIDRQPGEPSRPQTAYPVLVYHAYGQDPCGGVACLALRETMAANPDFTALRHVDLTPVLGGLTPEHRLACDSCGEPLDQSNLTQTRLGWVIIHGRTNGPDLFRAQVAYATRKERTRDAPTSTRSSSRRRPNVRRAGAVRRAPSLLGGR